VHVGLLLVWQNWHEDLSDEEMYREEIKLGLRAEELGFDSLWSAEHHFDDYSMCPDNMQVMSYFAGRTSRIKLGTGAVIVPWWDPLRVAEKVALLDHLCDGRLILGLGRGLAKMEYEGFRADMNASREVFDEAADLLLRTLDTGIAESDGPRFPQPRVEIRPAPNPERSFRARLFCVAMSPDSVEAAGDLGATMMSFIQRPIDEHLEMIERWRERFREKHPELGEPPPPLLTDFTYCHEDAAEAERMAHEYIGRYFLSVIKHYDFAGTHWRETKGYQAYQRGADMIREAGMETAAANFVRSQIWGTPEQIVEKMRARMDVVGEFQSSLSVSYAGMPFDKVNDSLSLLGTKVVPELQKLGLTAAARSR
jgi:alkanesulfonate monooxygenase SsuD/methylene tetrahydromethanopterin reductase-like flavin-dependent oxidoreductase (luciferase family)